MMKRILAASALVALIASPALAAGGMSGYRTDVRTNTWTQNQRSMRAAPGYDSYAFADENTGWSRPGWNRGQWSLGRDIGTDPDPAVRSELERGSVRYE